MSKKDNDNKDKKKDNILDLIWDLDLDLDLEEDGNNENQKITSLKDLKSPKSLETLQNLDALQSISNTKSIDNLQKNKSKLISKSKTKDINKKEKKEKNKKNQKELLKSKNNVSKNKENISFTKKNKLTQEDTNLLEKLITNITSFINEEDQKTIKEIKEYFYNNLNKKKFRKLFETNINDEIFENNIVFLINGFGYYYNPYKNIIIDFLFPFDLIYFPLIFDYKKIKINILFREKSIAYIFPKSDFILKKIIYKYIFKKHNESILRELNLKNLDSYDKMMFFIYFYLQNYYKIDLKNHVSFNIINEYNINNAIINDDININSINIENLNTNFNFRHYINLPIKKVANFLGISYETLIRNLKKMKELNLLLEKENKIFINLNQFKDDFKNLENKLIIC